MKPTKTILTLLMCFSFFGSHAQTANDKLVIPLHSINTVVLDESGGVCKIFPSPSNEILAQSELHARGGKWGWSFPKKRPLFKITYRQSNDTLYVDMPKAFSFKTIGVSTYAEQITSIVQIPANKHIIVKKADKLIRIKN
jgi:hypothetical protein